MDALIGRLLLRLKTANILNSTNLVIVSDHGMKELNFENYFNFHKIPKTLYDVKKSSFSSVTIKIWPRSNHSKIEIMKILHRNSDKIMAWANVLKI